MLYLLFIIAIALAGIALFQFAYLAFLDANNRMLRKELEELQRKLPATSMPGNPVTQSQSVSNQPSEDIWPEYIESEQHHL
jgi:hypothetical protein